MKYVGEEKELLLLMDVPSVWVVLLATVSVEGLIDVCQLVLKRLPEANFQSKLGHIPLGSLWQLHRGTPKVCVPPNSQFCLPRIWTDCLGYSELRSQVVSLGNFL